MAKHVSTTRYVFSHGRKPAGRGYWAFEFGTTDGVRLEFIPGELLYSEAKRRALSIAQTLEANAQNDGRAMPFVHTIAVAS